MRSNPTYQHEQANNASPRAFVPILSVQDLNIHLQFFISYTFAFDFPSEGAGTVVGTQPHIIFLCEFKYIREWKEQNPS